MRPHIVVIDDNPDMQRLFCDCLDGCMVTSIASPPANLSVILTLAPDLIILDCWFRYPAACQELVRQLHHIAPTATIPLLICSADTPILDPLMPTFRALSIPVLLKPFFLETLLKSVAEATRMEATSIRVDSMGT